MSSALRYENLTPPDLQQVNAVCDRFEHALRGGEPVRAEDWAGEGPLRDVLLTELLLLECEYAFRGRTALDRDTLERRFPDRPEFLRQTIAQAEGYAGLHDPAPLAVLPHSVGRFLIRAISGSL